MCYTRTDTCHTIKDGVMKSAKSLHASEMPFTLLLISGCSKVRFSMLRHRSRILIAEFYGSRDTLALKQNKEAILFRIMDCGFVLNNINYYTTLF